MKLKHLWSTEPSCLDSAYERKAIEQGLANGNAPVFPENNLQLHYLGHIEEFNTVWDESLTSREKKILNKALKNGVKIISEPTDFPVTIYGIDQFGNEFSEEIMVPKNGDVVTTNNKFYTSVPEYK